MPSTTPASYPRSRRSPPATSRSRRAWLIRLGGRPVGYVVLAWTFSVEAGGREACVDELYLLPEVRDRGLGGRALALVEDRGAGTRRAADLPRGRAPQPRPLALYRRAGYVDHDRFLMSKFLDR